jgi:hypothetical protein
MPAVAETALNANVNVTLDQYLCTHWVIPCWLLSHLDFGVSEPDMHPAQRRGRYHFCDHIRRVVLATSLQFAISSVVKDEEALISHHAWKHAMRRGSFLACREEAEGKLAAVSVLRSHPSPQLPGRSLAVARVGGQGRRRRPTAAELREVASTE